MGGRGAQGGARGVGGWGRGCCVGGSGVCAVDGGWGEHGCGGLRAAELAGSAYVEQVAFMERVIFGDDPDDGI